MARPRPRPHPPAASAASSSAPAPPPAPRRRPLTLADVRAAAAARSVAVSIRELGPLWEVTLLDEGREEAGGTSTFSNPSRLLARAAGTTLGRVCRIDSLVVETRRVAGEDGARVRPGLGGTGVLAARAVFALAAARGAATAQILAVDDDPATHARLVAVYGRAAGFKEVKRITGGSLSDVPHMLVWGGAGTRMDADVGAQLLAWGPREGGEGGGD